MNSRLFVKRFLGRHTPSSSKHVPRKIFLLYHSVGEAPWATPTRQFCAHIEWLSNNTELQSGYDLIDNKSTAPLQVAIMFDDGYASVKDIAQPILAAKRITGSVFINTNYIDDASRRSSRAALGHYPNDIFLSWKDILALSKEGWIIGSHGADHIDLTREPDVVVHRQLTSSKQKIESILTAPCYAFSYTWGRFTPRLQSLVKTAGYHYAFTGRHSPLQSKENLMAIPRINISNDYSLKDFQAIVRGDWDYISAVQNVRAIFSR